MDPTNVARNAELRPAANATLRIDATGELMNWGVEKRRCGIRCTYDQSTTCPRAKGVQAERTGP